MAAKKKALTKNQRFAQLVGGALNGKWGAGLSNLDVNDADMQAAISSVQRLSGLKVTGKADNRTLAAIQSGPLSLTGTVSASGTATAPVNGKIDPAPDPDAVRDQRFSQAFNAYMGSGMFMDGTPMAWGAGPGGKMFVTTQGAWDQPDAPPGLAAAAQRAGGYAPAPQVAGSADPWASGAPSPLVAPWSPDQATAHNRAVALSRAASQLANTSTVPNDAIRMPPAGSRDAPFVFDMRDYIPAGALDVEQTPSPNDTAALKPAGGP